MKFFKRLIGVLLLNEDAFFDLAMDRHASLQAFLVILFAAILGGLHWIITEGSRWSILIGLLLAALAGWRLYAGVIGFVGPLLFESDFSQPELLRVIGFSTGTLVFFSLPYIGLLSIIWFLAAVYRGLRSVFATSRQRTLILVLTGFFPSFIAWGVVVLIVTTVLSG